MTLDSEIRISLQRIENSLQNKLELRDFRNLQLAKAYLEEGQVATAMQFLKRIDRNIAPTTQQVIVQSLFVRALILVHNLQFTEAQALLVRLRKMKSEIFRLDDELEKDIEKIIHDIKIHQQATVLRERAESEEAIANFRESTAELLNLYLEQARKLLK
ncbi:MAG: hypothetical protein ACFFE8_12640 [Candidatus Heimdallarchaeota archaeon]